MTLHMRWRIAIPAGLLLVAGASLAACSSSGTKPTASGSATATPAATQATPAAPAAPHSDVAVTLKDFGVAATPVSAPAGHVTFVAQNSGAIPHELVVVKSDLAPDNLPQVNQKLVDVKQVQVIAKTEPFDGGTKRELTVELQPGRYVLLCNVASHYISGMHTAFTVTVSR